MSMDDRYTWRCVDCGRKARIAAYQFGLRTQRPRCQACGSTFFEPASGHARETFAEAGSFRKAGRGGR